MSKVALVAINIYYDDNGKHILFNKNAVPILFYWNKSIDSSIIESVLVNDVIEKIIKDNITNINIYTNTKISFICYNISGIDEKFEETTKSLQDYVTINNINNLLDNTIEDIAKDVYLNVFNAEYIQRNEDPIVYDIYAKSNLINGGQITLQTFLNYMRSILTKKYKLSNENIDRIIVKSGEIIDKTQKYHEND